jgi:hypothetical protein
MRSNYFIGNEPGNASSRGGKRHSASVQRSTMYI